MGKLNNNRGSTLAITLILLFVLTILGQAILTSSIGENGLARRYANSTKAFWVADAGIQKAIWEYKNNSCQGFVKQGTATACTDCACANATKTLAATLTGGDYDVTLDFTNTIIKVVGSVPSRTAANRVQRRLQISLGGGSLFNHGVFAKTKITFANNTSINGDVGTNGTASDAISLGTSGDTINGELSTGLGGGVSNLTLATVNGAPGNPANVIHTNSKSLPDVVVPSVFSGSSGTLTVPIGGTQSLGSNNYHYDNLDLKNNSTLNITGNVRLYLSGASAITSKPGVTVNINPGANLVLYVDGAVDFSNNMTINNLGASAGALQIYSTYTSALGTNGVTMSNGGNLYAAVYAPKTGINITNNSFLKGSVLGNTITFPPGVAINFDSGLNDISDPFNTVPAGTVHNWRDF